MGALSVSSRNYIERVTTMKLVFILAGLIALVSSMDMKQTLKNKCIKMTYTTTQIDYPQHVENETILDFKKLADLKAKNDAENKKKESKAPKAKILSFDKLKAKFGDKMVAKFKNMDAAAFGARSTVRVFTKN